MSVPRLDVREAGIRELLEAIRVVGRNLEREARFVRQATRTIEARLDELEAERELEQEAGAPAGDTIGHPRRDTEHEHDPRTVPV